MTFDQNDNVNQYYVSGVGGPVAVFHNNDDDNRYYLLKDHIGNTRGVVEDDGDVVEYLNYHPYGAISQSWANYDEPMKFTGKERDKHDSFHSQLLGPLRRQTSVT